MVWSSSEIQAEVPTLPVSPAAHLVPPSTFPPLPGIPWARDRSPGCVVGEVLAVSGKRRGQEWSWNYRVILSFTM